ncbi:MAG: 3-oxoacyl-ACP reductase FabG, partial [Candidatus Omnitrophica bacterium]|nr:3-oxoacyl-ACP reductase FabG [Candidatus Omnitrophota bacterium]
MQFKDQVVLVTGSARGIGFCVAKAFAQQGAMALIVDINEDQTKEVAASLRAEGLLADGFGCDVTSLESVQQTVDKILDIHKHIDILVNNAGITRDNLLLRMDESDWDAVIKVNLKGTYNVTKAVIRPMLKARKGKIISIASVIGMTGNIGQANYAASKAGVIAFSKSVAKELAARNITANCVAPGYIRTSMTDKIPQEVQNKVLERIPLSRFGEVSDVA